MQNLEILFRRSLDAVIGMDKHGYVIAWNAAAEEIFGFRREEALGARLADLIVPEQHRAAHTAGLAHYRATGKGSVLDRRIRISGLDRHGVEFPIELSIFPIEQDDEGPVFYAFVRSLAAEERHRREQERRSQEADILLEVAQKLLEDTTAEDVVRFCLHKVCDVAGLAAAHVHHARGSGSNRALVPSGIRYVSDERFLPAVQVLQTKSFAYGEGLAGAAWTRGDLVAIDNIPSDPQFTQRLPFAAVGLMRGIAVPIAHGGRTLAVMEFFGTEEGRFDADMLRLVRTVASQIGMAMHRKEEAEHREILRREIAHRTGNSLAILASIFRSNARSSTSVEELAATFLGRLEAVAKAQRVILAGARRPTPFAELVDEALTLLPDRGRVRVSLADALLEPDAVLPLALVLHELVTNTLKYGAARHGGEIRVEAAWNGEGGLIVDWTETLPRGAVPCARTHAQEPSEGYGSFLMRAMIETKLDGSFLRHVDRCGFRFTATLPRHTIVV